MKRTLTGVLVSTACAFAVVFGRTLPAGVEKEASMGGIEEINAVFRKHVDPNGLSIVKAGDFKTAGAYSAAATKNPQ